MFLDEIDYDALQTMELVEVKSPLNGTDAPKWAHILYDEMVTTRKLHEETTATVKQAIAELMPLVDVVSNHPMLKMLGI